MPSPSNTPGAPFPPISFGAIKHMNLSTTPEDSALALTFPPPSTKTLAMPRSPNNCISDLKQTCPFFLGITTTSAPALFKVAMFFLEALGVTAIMTSASLSELMTLASVDVRPCESNIIRVASFPCLSVNLVVNDGSSLITVPIPTKYCVYFITNFMNSVS